MTIFPPVRKQHLKNARKTFMTASATQISGHKSWAHSFSHSFTCHKSLQCQDAVGQQNGSSWRICSIILGHKIGEIRIIEFVLSDFD